MAQISSAARGWRIFMGVLAIALVLAVAGLLVVTLNVLLLIFGGVLFGIFLNVPSQWLSRATGAPYRAMLGAVLAVYLGVVAAGIYFLGAAAVEQYSELEAQLRTSANQLWERANQTAWGKRLLPDDWQSVTDKIDRDTVAQVFYGMQSAAWALTGMLVVFFVGAYVAYEPELYEGGLVKLAPPESRHRTREMIRRVRKVLSFWIVGRLTSMTFIGVLTSIALWAMGVPLPIPLGVIAAVLTFIPNVGPVLAAIPQVLMALQVGGNVALYVVLFNVALQMVESYLVTPIVERYAVSLPPALTVIVQLLLAVLIGAIGMIMAAPLTAAALVVVNELYIHDRLEHDDAHD